MAWVASMLLWDLVLVAVGAALVRAFFADGAILVSFFPATYDTDTRTPTPKRFEFIS